VLGVNTIRLNLGEFVSFFAVDHRYHIWDFFEKCLEFQGHSNKFKASIAEGVLAIKAMDEHMKGKNDLKFRSLVCFALNHHVLHHWVSPLSLSLSLSSLLFSSLLFSSFSFFSLPLVLAHSV
jgi:hypothetical protein